MHGRNREVRTCLRVRDRNASKEGCTCVISIHGMFINTRVVTMHGISISFSSSSSRDRARVYIYIYAYNPKKEVDVEADSRDWDRSEGRSFREKMKEQNYSYNFSQPCCEVSVVKVKSTLFFGLNYKYNIYFDSFHQCEYRSVKQMY